MWAEVGLGELKLITYRQALNVFTIVYIYGEGNSRSWGLNFEYTNTLFLYYKNIFVGATTP